MLFILVPQSSLCGYTPLFILFLGMISALIFGGLVIMEFSFFEIFLALIAYVLHIIDDKFVNPALPCVPNNEY
jgi:hypothetical protein